MRCTPSQSQTCHRRVLLSALSPHLGQDVLASLAGNECPCEVKNNNVLEYTVCFKLRSSSLAEEEKMIGSLVQEQAPFLWVH